MLDYFNHLDNKELIREKPFDYSVWVTETKVPQNYARRQIVIRHFGPKITYDQYHLWGVKLSSIIPEILLKKIGNYRFFKQARTELVREKADFIIESKIANIEFTKSNHINQARLVMEFTLRKTDQETILIRHQINREDKLSDASFDNFVLRINTILLQEMDVFLEKTKQYFETGLVKSETIVEKAVTQHTKQTADISLIDGMGTINLPNISGTDNEPYYQVLDKRGNEVASERMGTAVALPTGEYHVVYGSGSHRQMMMQENVPVHARYQTTIEPDWGCLLVDIQDEDRNYAKIRYEIFDAETGESYGDEFPKNEEIGEKEPVWILPPGLYRVIINNEPFNTIRNYTTVLVEVGKMHRLRIVVGLDEDGNPTNLIGSGILSGKELLGQNKLWKIYSAIHGNLSVVSKNETDKDEQETSITLTSQLESQLVYDKKPFHFISKNIIDLGTTKTSDTDFRLSLDNFDFKNTFIYYFLQDIGLYARLNMNTHLFPSYSYFSEPTDYVLIDEIGDTLSTHVGKTKILTNPIFYPLNLKEGAGLNIRVFNLARVSTYLRFGFGMEQNIRKDVFAKDSNLNVFYRQKSEYKEGMEISIISSIQLLPSVTYATDAYVLFPFNSKKNRTIEWENTITFKLFRYVSLDYKLRLENRFINEDEYLYNRQSLFLRVTYFLN
jgi:hypothetical protein